MRAVCVLVSCLVACGGSNHHDVDALTECSPESSHRCVGATFQTCTAGTWQTALDCPEACIDGIGCVDCVPGEAFCKNGNVWACDAHGNPSTETQVCGGNTVCVDAGCADACADAETSRSYIGCEYWAVDLDNAIEVRDFQNPLGCFGLTGAVPITTPVCYRTMGSTKYQAGLCDPQDDGTAPHTCPTSPNVFTCTSQPVCVLDAQHSPFAIVVSNPQQKDVIVTVTNPTGQMITQTIAAGVVVAIQPQAASPVMADQSVEGTVKAKRAYKVSSTLPIVAYQFNPLNNADVFSNDASLLIPRTAFDTDYYTMSYPTLDRRTPPPNAPPNWASANSYYGYLTVVAWQDNTQITVTPTVAVQASQTQTTIAANAPTMFTLNAFEVLQLEASGAGDLSGTHITSQNMMSFGVFGGHEAGRIASATPPDATHINGPCCADHLEEMLFPSSTWGKTFAITRSEVRQDNVKPPDYIRVLAQKPGTSVTFTPAATTKAGNCAALAPGQYCDVEINVDTEITASEPVMVGHYLESAIWNDGFFTSVGSGDPSMAIAVPTEQFRKDYAILTPAEYAKNYISIAAASTGGVTVDGTAVTLTQFPGGGSHRAARVEVTKGQHKIKCADGCGITVYGYSDAVSYMFAGGLDLKQIVIL